MHGITTYSGVELYFRNFFNSVLDRRQRTASCPWPFYLRTQNTLYPFNR